MWHWVIRYSDKYNWLTEKQPRSSLHDGFTISVSPMSETMSSSINWMNSGHVNTHDITLAPISVRTLCVDNCKQRWYSPHLYAYNASKSVVTILRPTELNSCASSWRNAVRCSTANCCSNSTSQVLSAKLLLTKHIFCVTSVTRRLLDTTTSGTARRRLGGAPARPNPSSQYEI